MRWTWTKALGTMVAVVALIGAVATGASAGMSHDSKGRFVLDGKPRFVLGVYDSGLSYFTDPASYENALFGPSANRLNDLPINLYLNYHYGQAPMSAMNPLMDVLHNHGVKYLQTANCFDSGSYTRIPFAVDQSDSYPQQFSLNPGAAGYYIMDECTDSLIAETTAHHERLKRLTPNMATLAVTLARGYVDPDKWADAADILGTDPYPLFGAEPAAGYTHFQVADFVAQAARAAGPSKPSMAVLQFFKFTADSRFPTPGEYRSHAVMSIVEGAKGIMWWEIGSNGLRQASSTTVSTQMGYLRTLVKELSALEPVLIADDAPGALVGNSTRFADPMAGRKQQLQYDIQVEWLFSNKDYFQAELNRLNAGDTSRSPMLDDAANIRTRTKVVDGKGYVFAYNYTNKSTPVTFTWQTAPGTVRENQSGRTYEVSGSSWSDTFGPYEARIYVVSNGGSGGTTTPPPPPTKPSVTFRNPASNATVSGTTTVTMAASGGSGSGYTYKLAVDGASVYTGTNPSFRWHTKNGANGTRVLTATVTDSAGASGTATRSVIVSNTTPFTASIKSPTHGTTVSGQKTIAVSTSAVSGQTKQMTVLVDGKTLASNSVLATSLWVSWNTTKFTDGPHTLTLKVTQNGFTATATHSVTVSNGGGTTPPPPPALRADFVNLPTGTTLSATRNIAFTASGGSGTGYRLALAVDGTTLTSGTATSYSWDTTRATNGSHTLTVTVTDSSGAKATATRIITVSNIADAPDPDPTPTPEPEPADFTASFLYPAEGADVSGGHTVGMATTATWGQPKTFTLLVDNTVILSQSMTGTTFWITWNTTTISNGHHTLTLKVTDGSGATATATRAVNVAN